MREIASLPIAATGYGRAVTDTSWEYWIFNPINFWNKDEQAFSIPRIGTYQTHQDVLNAVGDLGWECFAVTDKPNAPALGVQRILLGEITYYFKRVKSAREWHL